MVRTFRDARKAELTVRAAGLALGSVQRKRSAWDERKRAVVNDAGERCTAASRLGQSMRERKRRNACGSEKFHDVTSSCGKMRMRQGRNTATQGRPAVL